MQKVKLQNMARGVLVIPDLNGMNHINVPVGESILLTEREYFYYKKHAEIRQRNKLLKISMETVEHSVPAEKDSDELADEKFNAEFSEADGHDDEFSEPSSEEDLAGMDEESDSEGEKEVVKKKKKKKKKKSKPSNQ